MAGRYRALLIGNSTYPADEHNLQPLRGPVKDIAALHRALVDRDTGLFADIDVTLVPEATSGRAIRALGRFFGTAERDQVLLFFFSGHGRLDQHGRLHLCMQDTDSADLLATAVSSARINEFADASRARNVVIVLDCCHAGAFRGGDVPDTVAGPGRYVLTSCRGSQLANDATVDNGTSVFTQHLVDGLLTAAPDHDGDGYVGFSDLYTYVDRRMRESGKQIPQRRVDGDGDVRLARRPVPATPSSTPAPGPGEEPAGATPRGAAVGGRPVLLALAGAVAVLMAAGAVLALLRPWDGDEPSPGEVDHVSAAPWRLRVEDRRVGTDTGCTVTLTEVRSGTGISVPDDVYGTRTFQIHHTGSFRWQANDPGCRITPLPGSGRATLPFAVEGTGDSDAFPAPARVSVRVLDFNGNPECRLTLHDPADGTALDIATARPGAGTVVLNAGGRGTVYLGATPCGVALAAAE
ncbi:caspase family protein [Jidongwangia harbinensis]|uniref:caspase family protein n=1 Tax=Jidongwangia harbinensis TaxID=2878561 RepID=UPI001CDA17CD|nr:caspase family protein [Jidongwangia harbinensis]MCA2214025.1 caspase family protein [Jidongwangia harbinensis]